MRTGIRLSLVIVLALSSCKDTDPAPGMAPSEANGSTAKQSNGTVPVSEDRLTMELVERYRAHTLRVDDESLILHTLPRSIPRTMSRPIKPVQTINALDVQGKAQELARLLDETESLRIPSGTIPPELQFSCVVMVDDFEEAWADLLRSGTTDVAAVAAQVLWKMHSVRYAKEVLSKVQEDHGTSQDWAPIHALVTRDCAPKAILDEVDKGDGRWGLWLASLAPHADLVPTLLKIHERKPTPYSSYALGASRDPRALEPLLAQLETRDYVMAGYAAQALGLLGMPEAEPHLVEALVDLNAWPLAHACMALGQIGTPQAIPHLEKRIGTYGGAIDVSGSAERAIQQIRQRHAH